MTGTGGKTALRQPLRQVYLTVGPVVYGLFSEEAELVVDDGCAAYFTTAAPTDASRQGMTCCQLKLVDVSSPIDGRLVYQDGRRSVWATEEGLERRLLTDGRGPYAFYRETDIQHIVIELPRVFHGDAIHIDTYFLEALALDRYLLRRDALVLHSAFIQWQGRGIAFTAPSGTGKSTQAALWQKYEQAEIVNGDRSVIVSDSARQAFDICGLPFCGSSGICVNKRVPLGAVVFISQAPVNQAAQMPHVKAVSKLFGEMSINKWNPKAVNHSLDLIEGIASAVPIVHLECNMERDAVDTLKDYLIRLPWTR